MEGKQIQRTIDDLREHIKYIEQTIAILQRMPYATQSKRGRKSMGAAERLEVSERMRNYWANRKRESVSNGN